jgi:hypothetical protein
MEIVGEVSFVQGKVSQAMQLGTEVGYARAAASSSLNVGTGPGFTIEGWINPANIDQLQPLVEWHDGARIGAHFWISSGVSGSLFANLVDRTGMTRAITSPGGLITENEWQHVALTYSAASGVAALYRNGTLVQQATLGTFVPQTSYDLILGRRIAGLFSGGFSGEMDEFSLYNRALTVSEIQSIFEAGSDGKCAPELSPVYVFGNGILLGPTGNVFVESVTVELASDFPDAIIFYTLDGSEPTLWSKEYTGPINLTRSAVVRALAFSFDALDWGYSEPVSIEIIPLHTLSFSTAGGGTVIAGAAGPHVHGTQVSLTALPLPGWTFLGWAGDAVGSDPSILVLMNRDKHVEAVFGTRLTTTVSGSGSVWREPVTEYYPFGSVVRLTGVPEAGTAFVRWGGAASGNTNPLLFTVTSANPTVTALFSVPPSGRVSLSILPEGIGTVTVSPATTLFTMGQTVTLTAEAGPGQEFLGWGGDASGAQNPLTLAMNVSKVVTAHFTSKPRLEISPGDLLEEGFNLVIRGQPGEVYRIEATSDFVTWRLVAEITNVLGVVQVLDSAAGREQQFYRATLLDP